MAAEDHVEPAASHQRQSARAPRGAARRWRLLRDAGGHRLVVRAETGQNNDLAHVLRASKSGHQIAVIARNAAAATEAVGDKGEYVHVAHFPDVASITQNGVFNKVSARI